MNACVRIGAGAGYSGDRIEPAVELAEHGALDYLVFECLAERTIAIAQQARQQRSRTWLRPTARNAHARGAARGVAQWRAHRLEHGRGQSARGGAQDGRNRALARPRRHPVLQRSRATMCSTPCAAATTASRNPASASRTTTRGLSRRTPISALARSSTRWRPRAQIVLDRTRGRSIAIRRTADPRIRLAHGRLADARAGEDGDRPSARVRGPDHRRLLR